MSKDHPTIEEHIGWRRSYLKLARQAVQKRDWIAASQFYFRAAFHEQVAKAVKARKRR